MMRTKDRSPPQDGWLNASMMLFHRSMSLVTTAVCCLILLFTVSALGNNGAGGIHIICAGLGRTGTLSLSLALEQLGFRPYHYIDFAHSQQWAEWSEFKLDSNDLIDLIVKDGYNTTAENPTSDIYMDVVKRYPNAKVVLTVRDNPVQWARSWKVLFDTMEFIPLFRHLKRLRCRMGMHLGLERCDLTRNWRNHNDEWLIQQYHAHNNQVMANVKQENLLVFNVKEGWGPLCAFLHMEVPINEETGQPLPFPNASTGINDKESLQRLRQIFVVVTYLWIPVVLLVLFLVARTSAVWWRKFNPQRFDKSKKKQ